nr:gamma-glutamylcyclotransferase family protein [Roseicella sp. DB1501]
MFLYGTLLDPLVLERVAGAPGLARRLRLALLPGWERVALRGTPYPTLRRRLGVLTPGAVLRPDPVAFARLTAYEGAEYRLVPVRVARLRQAGGGASTPLWARAWVAPAWRAGAPG